MSDTSLRSSSGSASLAHLLAVWLLVGSSFLGLGIDATQALVGYDEVAVGTLTLSGWDVGLLLATVVVSAGWVAGVRPSIRAGVAYFVVQSVVHLAVALPLSWAGLGAWAAVVARVPAIAVAAAVCLTPLGALALGWLRRRTRRLLGTTRTE
ncbi:hypothetical protein [Halobaculum lipolyticum]|uniref:Uncharacterized protein n=1 Tax=Halobaculum lipolyticum TaxID=3032001 RepID=A0ABD5WF50_9EURY|nr:hypothetical protein [Halobaculum sp. DT31]